MEMTDMQPTYTHIPDLLAQMPDIPPDSILSRTFYQDDGAKFILFGFAAGQELSEHTASVPAVLHFLKGEARIKLGSDEMDAHPGAWAHLPPHLPHSVFAKTDVIMLLAMLS